jgi:hypothetical protein
VLERQLNEEAAKNPVLNEMKNLDLSRSPSTEFTLSKAEGLRAGFEMTPLVPDLSHPPSPLAQDRPFDLAQGRVRNVKKGGLLQTATRHFDHFDYSQRRLHLKSIKFHYS